VRREDFLGPSAVWFCCRVHMIVRMPPCRRGRSRSSIKSSLRALRPAPRSLREMRTRFGHRSCRFGTFVQPSGHTRFRILAGSSEMCACRRDASRHDEERVYSPRTESTTNPGMPTP
jgi:hypothetical protein